MPSLKGKHITLISLNFFPEQTAIGLYSTQMAQYLNSQGAIVTVITAYPYYPQWEIYESYRNKGSRLEEEWGGMRILRYKQYTPSKPSFIKRIFHIIDFTLGSWHNLKKVTDCDIVISVIPFTSSAWLGNKLSRKHKAKHWIHIQDFEFDAAFQSGLTSSDSKNKGFVYSQLMKLERSVLDGADKVSTISHKMLEKLRSKTTTLTYYLPNWIEASQIQEVSSHPFLASEKFKILYSGNIGAKQDWNFFLEVIAQLDLNLFEVVIVGDGAQKDWLQKQLRIFKNIKIHPPVPFSELTSLLISADVHILFQKTAILDTVMPSKVLGMMASEKPSIVTGHPDAEVGNVLNDSKGGFYVAENNVQRVLDYLNKLRMDNQYSVEMGKYARKYVVNKYEKGAILATFSSELLGL